MSDVRVRVTVRAEWLPGDDAKVVGVGDAQRTMGDVAEGLREDRLVILRADQANVQLTDDEKHRFVVRTGTALFPIERI